MRIMLLAGLVGFGLAQAAMAQETSPPVQVMVLGSYHFGNPGLDTNNMQAESVLTPQRQKELERVAQALVKFRPTHVMVEMQSKEPGLAIGEYRRFDAKMLATDANEIVQIGYRVAKLAGLADVQGIDEQPAGDEPDYYPYDKVQATAAKFGQSADLVALNTPVAAWLKKLEASQKTLSIAQMLMINNDPAEIGNDMDSYYGMLPIGDADTQTGADLNAMWYLRNAKIFSKLMHLAKPGAKEPARVLVVYGGGHGFWLRHFAQLTPGYRNVDVLPYLKQAR
ncbi:DUF5694 domain-containing protein [Sandarakinorhabdus sp.]|uniref:DUF5694 domain-containing protein n=1 Tax=Sandarakinorhabdus sp. TaxID=1916663 RepID=UPI00286DA554|nr:DUF5694 domain-containing protein [Sandarakinorhabdus sp.]